MPQSKGVAIVTGGSRGIGREVSLQLAQAGYDVVVNYHSNAAEAAKLLEKIGGKGIAVKADVSKGSDVLALFEAADALGTLSVLVNNAGIVDQKARVDEYSAERLNRMFAINITGSFLCAREAVKRMSTRHGGKGGAIVNVSSAAAMIGAPGEYVDYAASKGAIDTFTIGLAKEVAREGIRVNAVRPGLIATDIHASGGQPDRIARMRDVIPMGREGTAEEVANAIVWLASGKASYITGALLNVSGGRG
jgi:NAD(P)-dependent dehydrogenase (short-subunit alcohol dehydrogenase family)